MQTPRSQRHRSQLFRTAARTICAAAFCAIAAQIVVGCAGPTSRPPATQPATVTPIAVVAPVTTVTPNATETRQTKLVEMTGKSGRLIVDGRYAEALVILDEILALEPKNAYALATRPLIAERSRLDEAEDAIAEAQLQQRTDAQITFDGAPLNKALEDLAQLYGVQFNVDWKALEAAGFEKDTKVTLLLNKPSLSRALSRVLGTISTPTAQLGHSVAEGQIIISTAEVLSKNVVTRVYDIRDLVGQIPNFADAPDFNLETQRGGNGLFGGGGGGGLFSGGGGGGRGEMSVNSGRLASGGPVGGKPLPALPTPPAPRPAPRDMSSLKTREEQVEDIVKLTTETVAPDTWRDVGGSTGAIKELNGQLIVTQTRENHLAMTNLLQQLRNPQLVRPGVNPPVEPPTPEEQGNTEAYDRVVENPFLRITENPLSTFSIDVDTASYSNMRRYLTGGQLPPPDAVRIEELVNYFPYDYKPPQAAAAGDAKAIDAAPFAASVEVTACPWTPDHRLVRIGLKGREIEQKQRPASNLVFLIDVSGSMSDENKLPLVKQSLALLVGRLTKDDRVALAVYAGSSGLVLPSTAADEAGKRAILDAIDRLEAGGSTNGAQGIELAYAVAEKNLIKGGVNRVVLCTDGDFNVGITDQGQLTRLIEEQAKSGVFLSVLGYGMGNLKDATMEKLADKGNGNYAYIDTINEARKVLVEQMTGTLIAIAKDVKIQVEFNPAVAGAYRLVGYENRILAKEDFNDDKKDAGEIGAGHAVTALYEVVPVGQPIDLPGVDPLKYQKPAAEVSADQTALQIEAAKADLELKLLAQKRLESLPADKKASDIDIDEAKLAVRLAEIRLKQAGGNAPVPSKELLTVKLRYKAPDGDTSRLLQFPVEDGAAGFDKASTDFKFAAAVAGFGMNLRRSAYRGSATLESILVWATEGKGVDAAGYRAEFIELVKKAQAVRQGLPVAEGAK